jgi:hypothetical protein
MAKQVNVFLDNKPGRLKKVTQVLADAGVNIRAVEIQDRETFGIMKLLVNDPDKAHLALSDAGLASALKDVVAIIIDDKPGGLLALAEVLEKEGVNVVDGYGFVVDSAREAIWCFEAEDRGPIEQVIQDSGFRLLSDEELYEL